MPRACEIGHENSVVLHNKRNFLFLSGGMVFQITSLLLVFGSLFGLSPKCENCSFWRHGSWVAPLASFPIRLIPSQGSPNALRML